MAYGRNPVILMLAVGSGILAFFLSLRMMSTPAPAKAESIYVVAVALRDIPIGGIIRNDDVDLLPPPSPVNQKLIFEELGSVVGKVVRRNVPKGEPIRKMDILEEGDNLASLIPKGYRAMTIPVTLPDSITELLQIGNRVDVILTYEVGKTDFKSLTLVENARVIGVSKPEKKTGGANQSLDITLSVTPEGAETLAFASKRGTLNVSIRSLDEEGSEKFFTLKELFFPKDNNQQDALQASEKPAVPKDVIEIIRGVTREEYATVWE